MAGDTPDIIRLYQHDACLLASKIDSSTIFKKLYIFEKVKIVTLIQDKIAGIRHTTKFLLNKTSNTKQTEK